MGASCSMSLGSERVKLLLEYCMWPKDHIGVQTEASNSDSFSLIVFFFDKHAYNHLLCVGLCSSHFIKYLVIL